MFSYQRCKTGWIGFGIIFQVGWNWNYITKLTRLSRTSAERKLFPSSCSWNEINSFHGLFSRETSFAKVPIGTHELLVFLPASVDCIFGVLRGDLIDFLFRFIKLQCFVSIFYIYSLFPMLKLLHEIGPQTVFQR